MSKLFSVCAMLLFSVSAAALSQQNPLAAATAPSTQDSADATAEGLIRLDVVVADKSGNPVAGLGPGDFKLLDNGQPAKVLSFRAFDGASAKPDPPGELILVIDTVNLSTSQIPDARLAAEKFLRANQGHLAEPVSIFLFSAAGLSSMPSASTDGNALADAIAHGGDFPVRRQAAEFHPGHDGPDGPGGPRTLVETAIRNSLNALGYIAITERLNPARKLLVWIGPGWRMDVDRLDYAFGTVTELSTRLREARIALWSVTEWPNPDPDFVYQFYLDPVRTADKVRVGDLALPVLAVQSGGGVRSTGGDLAQAIQHCVERNRTFYTLTFEPPATDEMDEYHQVRVIADRPDLTARTSTGYYDEPVYNDQPPKAEHVTVGQLEQMLETVCNAGDKEAAEKIEPIELTERMTSARLASWEARLPGKKSRSALVAIADQSVFLALPAADTLAIAPPDYAAARLMLSRSLDYLNRTMLKLPNFFATRLTIQYDEPSPKDGQNWKTVTSDRSLHMRETSKSTVLFRDGREVVDAGTQRGKPLGARERKLDTHGTFGPVLAMVFAGAAAAHSQFTWSHWEQGAGGPQAVFRYAVQRNSSLFEVGFCCRADPDGTVLFKQTAGYHGEIAIDPESGAVLRLTVEADLEPRLPLKSSGVMVEYGPVAIGGRTYICPTRSVSIARQRTVNLLHEWGESFGVYGRYETILNDVTFTDYHVFRTESRILASDSPDQK